MPASPARPEPAPKIASARRSMSMLPTRRAPRGIWTAARVARPRLRVAQDPVGGGHQPSVTATIRTLEVRDHDAARRVGPDRDDVGRVGLGHRPPEDPRQVLERQEQAERADERHDDGRAAQRAVGDPLEEEADGGAGQDGEHRRHERRRLERDQQRVRQHAAQHVHAAVGDVDDPEDAVRQRQADRQQGIEAADREPVEDVLGEEAHAARATSPGRTAPAGTA